MTLSRLLLAIAILLLMIPLGIAEAAMVNFELPTYTAGTAFVGVDGWASYFGATTVVTPDIVSGDSTVLSGSQSGRLSGSFCAMDRHFDAGPTEYGNGTIVSGHMLVEGTSASGTSGELFLCSPIGPTGSGTPAGIAGKVGGNFNIFCSSGWFDTGIQFLTNVDYLLEMELDLSGQSFTSYATNVTAGGSRTKLGTTNFAAAPRGYAASGFGLITRGATVIYDDLDVMVVPPEPVKLLPEPVDFENPVYVVGGSVAGVDGWSFAGSANAVVTNTTVLAGTKSVKLSGPQSIIKRNFGEGTTYDNGSIISTKVMAKGSAGGNTLFCFSNDQTGGYTPAGIIGYVGGNFWIYGKDEGTQGQFDTGIAFEADNAYLLEIQLDLEQQEFISYETNITDGGQRTWLGRYDLWSGTIAPGDGTNSGYVLFSREGAEVYYDDLNVTADTLPVIKPGDANKDGVVNEKDASLLAANWLTGPDATWKMGDFNDDGYVNDLDATLMASNWTVAGASASVPEPSTLIALLGLLFVRRRRR